jgi:hypothetical protein
VCIGQVNKEELICNNIYFQAYSELMNIWQLYNNITGFAWHKLYDIVGTYYTVCRVNSVKLLFSSKLRMMYNVKNFSATYVICKQCT